MKRRNFFKALLGVPVAATIVSKTKTVDEKPKAVVDELNPETTRIFGDPPILQCLPLANGVQVKRGDRLCFDGNGWLRQCKTGEKPTYLACEDSGYETVSWVRTV